MNPMKHLEACGQSPWLDFLKRSLIEKGELHTMIEREGIKGVTSNPSIFEKAIGESDEYKEALQRFQALADHGIPKIYEHLAIADIRAAAAVLRPVYDETKNRDGYISLECSPYLANDTEATVGEALRLWKAIERPNLMVKVPATPAGIPAIRQLIGRGLNICPRTETWRPLTSYGGVSSSPLCVLPFGMAGVDASSRRAIFRPS